MFIYDSRMHNNKTKCFIHLKAIFNLPSDSIPGLSSVLYESTDSASSDVVAPFCVFLIFGFDIECRSKVTTNLRHDFLSLRHLLRYLTINWLSPILELFDNSLEWVASFLYSPLEFDSFQSSSSLSLSFLKRLFRWMPSEFRWMRRLTKSCK